MLPTLSGKWYMAFSDEIQIEVTIHLIIKELQNTDGAFLSIEDIYSYSSLSNP